MNNRIRLSLLLAPACLLTAWANSVVDVVTDSNYRLRGEIVSYGKQGIVIKHPAMRQNAVILPVGNPRALFHRHLLPGPASQGQDFHGYGTSGHHPVQHHLHHAGQGAVPGHAGQRAFHPPRPGGRLRLDTLQEKGFWQEPLIFDNSWVYSGNREDDYRTQSGRKLMNALKPKIQGDKYQYRLGNSDYPTWIPLYKNIGLDPSSFTFRTTMTMDGNNDRAGIVFCFGGNENIPFRSNSGSSLNRLMLSIAPGKCILLREQKSGIIVLGEVDIPTPTLTEGVDIRLTASRQGENEQVYELLVGDLPPKLMTDPSPPGTTVAGGRLRPPDGRARLPDHQQAGPFLHYPERQIRDQEWKCRNGPCPDEGGGRHSRFHQQLQQQE